MYRVLIRPKRKWKVYRNRISLEKAWAILDELNSMATQTRKASKNGKVNRVRILAKTKIESVTTETNL